MAYKTKLKIMFNVSMCLDLAMVPDEFQPQLRTLKDDITPSWVVHWVICNLAEDYAGHRMTIEAQDVKSEMAAKK